MKKKIAGLFLILGAFIGAYSTVPAFADTINSLPQYIISKDEGVQLTPRTTSLNFVGAGVTATNVGNAVTVTVPGASSSLSLLVNGNPNADQTTLNLVQGTGVTINDLGSGIVQFDAVTPPGGVPGQLQYYDPTTSLVGGVNGSYFDNATNEFYLPNLSGVVLDATSRDKAGLFDASGLSRVRTYTMPDNDGVFAMTVNGTSADSVGAINIPVGTGTLTDITAGTGLSATPSNPITVSGTLTANLSTGISGGQSAIGGTGASENLTLSSTTNGTKGKIILGAASAYDQANDRLGIGTTSPTSKVTVTNQTTFQAPVSGTTIHFVGVDANPLRLTLDTHNTAAGGTALMFRRSRGTSASPSAVASGDTMGSLNSLGYGTSQYAAASTGLISFKANQNFTNTANGTYIGMFTTPDNSVTAAEALRVTGAGQINAIQAGGVYQINSADVLSSTTLGSTVVNSSLTSVGTIGTGVWSGTTILANKGGTGFGSYAVGDLLYADTTSTLAKLPDVAVGSVLVSGGTNTAPAYSATPQLTRLGIGSAAGSTTELTITQPVRTTGSPTALTLTGGAHTTLAASTEAIDVNFNLARTVQFATGALTTQRAMYLQAPTYGFVGSSTITNAITLQIDPPVAGTNATITNPLALFVNGNWKYGSGVTGLYFRPNTSSSSFAALYSTNVTPSSTNHVLIHNGITTMLNATSAGNLQLQSDGSTVLTISSSAITGVKSASFTDTVASAVLTSTNSSTSNSASAAQFNWQGSNSTAAGGVVINSQTSTTGTVWSMLNFIKNNINATTSQSLYLDVNTRDNSASRNSNRLEFAYTNVGSGTQKTRTSFYNLVGGTTLTEAARIDGTDLKLLVAGGGLYVKEGSNATMGTCTLVAGTCTVSTTKVTANSRIFLTRQTTAGTIGTSMDITARTAGTSFVITSNGSVLDTSVVAWMIVEPS